MHHACAYSCFRVLTRSFRGQIRSTLGQPFRLFQIEGNLQSQWGASISDLSQQESRWLPRDAFAMLDRFKQVRHDSPKVKMAWSKSSTLRSRSYHQGLCSRAPMSAGTASFPSWSNFASACADFWESLNWATSHLAREVEPAKGHDIGFFYHQPTATVSSLLPPLTDHRSQRYKRISAPGEARTRNLWIRSPLLYPIELRGQAR